MVNVTTGVCPCAALHQRLVSRLWNFRHREMSFYVSKSLTHCHMRCSLTQVKLQTSSLCLAVYVCNSILSSEILASGPSIYLWLFIQNQRKRKKSVESRNAVYSVSQKNPPYGFLKFFPKWLGIFNQFFTHLLYDHFYTRVQIFIQIFPTLTKLCHTKRDHLAKFYISLEL